jgi:hypothetical protein
MEKNEDESEQNSEEEEKEAEEDEKELDIPASARRKIFPTLCAERTLSSTIVKGYRCFWSLSISAKLLS